MSIRLEVHEREPQCCSYGNRQTGFCRATQTEWGRIKNISCWLPPRKCIFMCITALILALRLRVYSMFSSFHERKRKLVVAQRIHNNTHIVHSIQCTQHSFYYRRLNGIIYMKAHEIQFLHCCRLPVEKK